jgi:AAA domain
MASKKNTPTIEKLGEMDIIDRALDGVAEEITKRLDEVTTPKPGLKIFAFGAENIKRLKVVQIHPKQNMVQISGENESGKSSVLDSIEWGLCGTSSLTSAPIRQGEKTGKIQIHLKGDLDKEYKITRFFNASGNKLQIEGKDREMFKSPQTLLDSLMGKISFDPLTFIRMDPKKQLETLRSLVTVDVDIDAIDAAHKADYEDRRVTGRDIDSLKARLAALPATPEYLPAEPIDTEEITTRLQQVSDHNNGVHERNRAKAKLEEMLVGDAANVAHREKAIKEAEELIVQLRREIETYAKVSAATREQIAGFVIPELMDAATIGQELNQANATNAAIEKRKHREAVAGDLEDAEKEYAELDTRIVARQKERTEAIARAKMPVEDLGFGEGEVLYKDLPFSQASNAVQIRVSVALAMASNPTIRVLRIKDGSLLDRKSMEILTEMAEANNYQVWVERVESSGAVGVVMVDGEATGEEAV